MKKIAKTAVLVFCIMSMLFSIVAVAQPAETTFTVISQTIQQGGGTEAVEVPIEISNNQGILGMTLKISYDKELTLTNAAKGEALSSLTFTKGGDYRSNPFNLVWDGEASADTSNGVVATLTFTVPKGTAKDYSITITPDGVYDEDVHQFYPAAVNGKISVAASSVEPSKETTFTVISQTIQQGDGIEAVEVPIEISNNQGILGMTLKISYDKELTLTNAAKGEALSSLTFTKGGDYRSNPFNLVWDGEASADTSNGVVATLTFTVPKGTAKDYSITITPDGVYDEDVHQFYPAAVNGKISVLSEIVEKKPAISIGNITDSAVTVETTNCEGLKGIIILAIYNDTENSLKTVKMQSLSNNRDVTFSNLDLTNATIKAMLWDSLDSLCPLTESVSLKP